MKEITKELIDKTVSKAINNATENVVKLLIENAEAYRTSMDEIGNEDMKQYTMYIATMNTALQMSVAVIKESLYELLCEE